MSALHAVEAAWRRFRKTENWELFERTGDLRQSYLDSIELKQCPPEVILPTALPWNLLALAEARRRGDEIGVHVSHEGSILANTIHVWRAYRVSKTIFEVEPTLTECLERSPWPAETPTAALRLSSSCPVLSIPRDPHVARVVPSFDPRTGARKGLIYAGEREYIAATYDLLTGGEKTGILELRLSMLTTDGDRWIPISILHLTQPKLSECVEAAAAEARAHGGPDKTADAWRNESAGLALTLLLYLAGEPDVVRIVHPDERPIKPKLERKDPERFRDLKEPNTYAVGKAFARAIEHWEIEHRNDESVATGRTVRPHMRRAHSHLYWTGEGRKQPRVRFLLPIGVKGGRLVEEPEHPTQTRVE